MHDDDDGGGVQKILFVGDDDDDDGVESSRILFLFTSTLDITMIESRGAHTRIAATEVEKNTKEILGARASDFFDTVTGTESTRNPAMNFTYL